MDFLAMGFYGIVCGFLALAAPQAAVAWQRVAAGAVVGIVAALVLPGLRGLMGGY